MTGPALITGGAGFIGCNLADALLSGGKPVLILDNLSRPGTYDHVRWLMHRHGNAIKLDVADVRDAAAVARAVAHCDQIFHFAAQVAVTTSLDRPREDFEINAIGTLNLLEALRESDSPPPALFTSTNKVYGALAGIDLEAVASRYQPRDPHIAAHGIGESQPLDFHSPYGCSKGAADQYVLDYARSFGISAAVFRMSCIYGPHQLGTEDQGWVAHFARRALARQPITVFGDGRQVRDLLHASDLVRALILAMDQIDVLAGRAFNIGGGPRNAVSLLEIIELIGERLGYLPAIHHGAWRMGDQRYYVSDTRQIQAALPWSPRVDVRSGVFQMCDALSGDGRDTAITVSSPEWPVP